jgi:hypothetical protein
MWAWLPQFMRIVELIARHLDLSPDALLGPDIVRHARSLVDRQDRKVAAEVQRKVAAQRAFLQLTAAEVGTRTRDLPPIGESRGGHGRIGRAIRQVTDQSRCQRRGPGCTLHQARRHHDRRRRSSSA